MLGQAIICKYDPNNKFNITIIMRTKVIEAQ
jgi:hypothetical protein